MSNNFQTKATQRCILRLPIEQRLINPSCFGGSHTKFNIQHMRDRHLWRQMCVLQCIVCKTSLTITSFCTTKNWNWTWEIPSRASAEKLVKQTRTQTLPRKPDLCAKQLNAALIQLAVFVGSSRGCGKGEGIIQIKQGKSGIRSGIPFYCAGSRI